MPAAAEAKLEGSGKGIVAAKELLACRGITTQGCYCDVFIPRYAIPRGNKDGAVKKENDDSAHGTNKKYRPGE